MEHVSIEVWQQILCEVMETNDSPIFATSCTPYTFIDLHIGWQQRQKPYLDYLEQRRCLRLVCRAWNDFVLFTSHRWLLLKNWSPVYELDSTTTTRAKGVGPIENLAMKIGLPELVNPILSWASHILKRPASQPPLRAYILQLYEMPVPGYNLFEDLLVETTTTQDLECTNTNTNTTLCLLSLITPPRLDISISFLQISRTFTGLRSLFLFYVRMTPQQTLTLAHLGVLCVCSPPETLLESMRTWDTPALQHVYLGYFDTPLTRMLDRFLGRYAHQIESLGLSDTVHSSYYAKRISMAEQTRPTNY
jgi:hypothetical protein